MGEIYYINDYINANGLESEITEQDNMRNDISKFWFRDFKSKNVGIRRT